MSYVGSDIVVKTYYESDGLIGSLRVFMFVSHLVLIVVFVCLRFVEVAANGVDYEEEEAQT